MDIKKYGEQLERKADEWIGVLQERRMELEQEDIKEDVAYCDKQRAKIKELEDRIADIRTRTKAIEKSDEHAAEDLKKELDKIMDEFQCDLEEVVYYEEEKSEDKR